MFLVTIIKWYPFFSLRLNVSFVGDNLPFSFSWYANAEKDCWSSSKYCYWIDRYNWYMGAFRGRPTSVRNHIFEMKACVQNRLIPILVLHKCSPKFYSFCFSYLTLPCFWFDLSCIGLKLLGMCRWLRLLCPWRSLTQPQLGEQ